MHFGGPPARSLQASRTNLTSLKAWSVGVGGLGPNDQLEGVYGRKVGPRRVPMMGSVCCAMLVCFEFDCVFMLVVR